MTSKSLTGTSPTKTGGFPRFRTLTYAYVTVYGIACVGIAVYTGFYVHLNDFWGVFWIAEHLSLAEPASLHNSFHPVGYPLFIRLLQEAFRDPLPAALLASVCLGLVMLVCMIRIANLILGDWRWTFLCIVFSSLFWPLFMKMLTTSGSSASAAFAAAALAILLPGFIPNRNEKRPFIRALAAGALLGLAALWRYYGFGLGLSVSAAMFLLGLRDRKALLRAVACTAGFILIYSLQLGCNILAGHGLFETAVPFMAHARLYGLNWSRPPTERMTLAGIIASDPAGFFRMCAARVFPYLRFPLIPALNLAISPARRLRRPRLFILFVFLFYTAQVAVGGSIRGIILIAAPLMVETSAVLKSAFDLIAERVRRPALRYAALFALAALVPADQAVKSFIKNIAFVKRARTNALKFESLERALLREGVSNPKQVFLAVDFDCYFCGKLKYRPYHNGGWFRYDLWGYNERYPDLDSSSLDALVEDCRRHGISHIVLKPPCKMLLPELFEVYEGSRQSDSLRLVAEVEDYKIYRIVPPPG